MARRRGEVGKRRREQIVEAAVAIIAEKGLPELSLSAIEERANMSRGQLTYYFKTKEDILLAVFDRMLEMMRRQDQAGEVWDGYKLPPPGWERFRTFLGLFLLHPPNVPEFHPLQYTFLSQISHREDFRQRLADLYEKWRTGMAGDVQGELIAAGRAHVSARTFASLVQAILHGLAVQREADPAAFDPREMLALCHELLGGFLGHRDTPDKKAAPRAKKKKPVPKPGEP
jgi:AcrR family transcriptional regulator